MELINTVVNDRYHVLRELGRGGMSVVYLALDRKLDRHVALKTIRFDTGSSPEVLRFRSQALVREAKLAGRLNYPGIVTIHDVFELGELVSVTMEYIEGVTLEKALRAEHPPARPILLWILREVAKALDYAHSKGVVHRDIKPANIMIRTAAIALDERVKVADFGIARESVRAPLSGTSPGTTMVIGTPAYMSPEQVQGMRPEGPSDQFSLAVVAYEILTGRNPFPAPDTADRMARIAFEEPDPCPEVGPEVGAVLRRAFSKNPDERYQTCGEFVGLLEKALQSKEVQPRPVTGQPAPRRPPRLPWKWIGLALIAALVILAVSARSWLAEKYKQWSSPSVNAKDGLEYVWVSPGSFQMGCVPDDTECDYDEKPPHRVSLSQGFWMGRTEVTVQAYQRFAEATGTAMPQAPDFNPNWSEKNHPIVNVSWNEAVAYCEWAGGQLPTEAEWEYAARGGQEGLRYPWGNSMDHENANYGADQGSRGLALGRDAFENTAPVGSFPENAWGLFDMSGNVMEWTRDWYSDAYYRQPASQDPRGPATGNTRVLRGGGWENPPRVLRCSWRYAGVPGARRPYLGFRCVGEDRP